MERRSGLAGGLTINGNPLMMVRVDCGPRRSAEAQAIRPYDEPVRSGPALAFAHVAPSFNGRTAASGAAYRGSNPWGAAI